MIAPRPLTTRVSWLWEFRGETWVVVAEVVDGECGDLWVTNPGSRYVELAVTDADVGGDQETEERLAAEAVERAEKQTRAVERDRAIDRARGRE